VNSTTAIIAQPLSYGMRAIVANIVLDDVVTEDDANRLAGGKILRKTEDLGNALVFLVGGVETAEAKSRPLPSKRRKSPTLLPPVAKRISSMPALTKVWMR
jgi:hypothetical protein